MTMEELDEAEKVFKIHKKEWEKFEKEWQGERDEFNLLKEKALKDIEQAQSKRNKVESEMDVDALKVYSRLHDHFGPPVVVRAENEICTGCYVHIPAQYYNEVLKGERLITCTNCTKILIYCEKDLKEEIEPLT